MNKLFSILILANLLTATPVLQFSKQNTVINESQNLELEKYQIWVNKNLKLIEEHINIIDSIKMFKNLSKRIENLIQLNQSNNKIGIDVMMGIPFNYFNLISTTNKIIGTILRREVDELVTKIEIIFDKIINKI